MFSRYNKIYLYGAGKVARQYIDFLNQENIGVAGILVTNDIGKTELSGIPIDVFQKDMTFASDTLIIVAVGIKLQREIKSKLEVNGVTCDIYFQHEFSIGEWNIAKQYYLEREYHKKVGTYFTKYNELNKIGLKYNTDKCSYFHNYLHKYEFFLSKWKNDEIKLLELGVFKGASIRMWAEYFQRATIYGVDIDPSCKDYETEREKIIVGDLSQIDFLNDLKSINPNIIVDDASHLWSHQIKALFTLFDSLPSGGIYILEDLETNFDSFKNMNFGDSAVTCYDILSAIAEVVTSREYLRKEHSTVAVYEFVGEIEEIAAQIEFISFIHGSCIMIKR